MKFVLAPDSFKGSLTALEVCQAMGRGILSACPEAEIVNVPMADGGEGTVQSLVDATFGELRRCTVADPLGRPVNAAYGIMGDGTAVIEMAEASGLPLLSKEERDPLRASTFGTGQLILNALDSGCRRFILGIGGSATNDCGSGMARALGARFLLADGGEAPDGGGALGAVTAIDLSGLDPRVAESSFTVACDVDNPLCGELGASAVFGPQKGATPELVRVLDANLKNCGALLEALYGRPLMAVPGAGAAGGLGCGMLAFLNATLRPGVEIVLDAARLDEKLKDADFVFTGEGRSDMQTAHGKTPYGVAMRAKAAGVPVVLLSGSLGGGTEVLYGCGISSMFSLADGPMTLDYAIENGAELLARAAGRITRLILAARKG